VSGPAAVGARRTRRDDTPGTGRGPCPGAGSTTSLPEVPVGAPDVCSARAGRPRNARRHRHGRPAATRSASPDRRTHPGATAGLPRAAEAERVGRLLSRRLPAGSPAAAAGSPAAGPWALHPERPRAGARDWVHRLRGPGPFLPFLPDDCCRLALRPPGQAGHPGHARHAAHLLHHLLARRRSGRRGCSPR
jgi:hypothetical protein